MKRSPSKTPSSTREGCRAGARHRSPPARDRERQRPPNPFPRTYYDRRQLAPIGSLVPGVDATFVGRVLFGDLAQPVSPSVVDGSGGGRAGRLRHRAGGVVQPAVPRQEPQGRTRADHQRTVWFLSRAAPGGEPRVRVHLRGRRGTSGQLRASSPVYRLTSGVSQRYLRGLIARTLKATPRCWFPETLPVVADRSEDAVAAWRRPRACTFRTTNREARRGARAHGSLEELFYMQLALSLSAARPHGVSRCVTAWPPRSSSSAAFSKGCHFWPTGAAEAYSRRDSLAT